MGDIMKFPGFHAVATMKRRPGQECSTRSRAETSMPGVFVAGDVRHGSVKRVASAVGEGSIAVQFMHQYLARF